MVHKPCFLSFFGNDKCRAFPKHSFLEKAIHQFLLNGPIVSKCLLGTAYGLLLCTSLALVFTSVCAFLWGYNPDFCQLVYIFPEKGFIELRELIQGYFLKVAPYLIPFAAEMTGFSHVEPNDNHLFFGVRDDTLRGAAVGGDHLYKPLAAVHR